MRACAENPGPALNFTVRFFSRGWIGHPVA